MWLQIYVFSSWIYSSSLAIVYYASLKKEMFGKRWGKEMESEANEILFSHFLFIKSQ